MGGSGGPAAGAIVVPVLLGLIGCAEAEIAAEAVKSVQRSAPAYREPVERDRAAPQVFETTTTGLWDGRPTPGGAWAAHPLAAEPVRVRITNLASGQSVTGALIPPEPASGGRPVQLSSAAAQAIGMEPGRPAPLRIVALRREVVPPAVATAPGETVPVPEADAAAPRAGGTDLAALAGPGQAAPAPPADPGSATGPAAAPAPPPPLVPPAAPEPRPAMAAARAEPQPDVAIEPPPARPSGTLETPYVQVGLFRRSENAARLRQELEAAGFPVRSVERRIDGRVFTRVLVGPAASEAELGDLLRSMRGRGFRDAIPVSG
ncbi:MAG TPA: SPOR domain-containing protein [Paracoccaceae bacterium]|nr:SPOR domain-containing protein [Paracoccaceae bacterium]